MTQGGYMFSTVAKVFGVVLLTIGVLGFIPALTPDDRLLGIFHVDPLHNLIHLSSGGVALWSGLTSLKASRLYFQVFGVVYALVAVLGFAYMEKDILDILANNMADNLLHVVIAGSALLLGFGPFDRPSPNKPS
jgi:hypothetical protein